MIRMMPNPNNLTPIVNGRQYTGVVNAPVLVPDFDAQVLGANGWTVLDPAAAETDSLAFHVANNLSEGVALTLRTNVGIGLPKHLLVTGDLAGDIAVTGIKTGDVLDEVIFYPGASVAITDILDLTAEFTITATNTINNAGGTATTDGKLLVRWTKKTA